jgi:uncharacterized protein (DUF433 family)
MTTATHTAIDWSQCPVLESVPGKVSGAWVFRGTRVPVSAVLKNLKDLSVNEVAEEFPSVTPDQIRTVLDFIARSADPVLPSV